MRFFGWPRESQVMSMTERAMPDITTGGSSSEVMLLEQQCNELKGMVDGLIPLQRSLETAPNLQEADHASRLLNEKSIAVLQMANDINSRLHVMHVQNAAMPPDDSNTYTRVFEHMKLAQRLTAILNEYQSANRTHLLEMHARFAQNYREVDPTISESQVRRLSMLRPEDVFTPELVRQAELAGHHNAVNAARNRYNDVQRIEEDVMQISRLQQDLHEIMAKQSNVIDRTEQNTFVTGAAAGRSVGYISSAGEHARHRRRRLLWLLSSLMLLVIIAIAIAVPIAVSGGGGQTAVPITNT